MPSHTPAAAAANSASRRAGRAPLLVAGAVFVTTILIALLAWHSASIVARNELEANFDYRARDLSANLARRVAVYEQVLRGARGFLRGSPEIGYEDFAAYYRVLNLEQHFPGIEALGIAALIPRQQLARHEAAMRRAGFPDYAVHPGGEREMYTSITHIEPFSGRNLRAFGYDMFSEPVRRQAMELARDTGRAAVSGKVVLVQEGARQGLPGFLMYLPLYRQGMPAATVAQRRAAITGWVYAPFRMNDLVRGIGGAHSADLEVAIYDGDRARADALLYRSGQEPGAAARAPMFTRVFAINPGGHAWTVVMRPAPSFEATLDTARPQAIAVSGFALGFLLSLVVWLLASERGRALALAGEMTAELRQSRDRIAADQQRMKLVLHNAYEAFIAIDARGRVTDWNAQAAKLFGWSEQEAVGRDLGELLVPEEQRAWHHAGFRSFSETGTGPLINNPSEMQALHRSGAQVPVELAIVALPTAAGYGAAAFVRDIAPRKEAERRERERQQRLDEARNALSRAQKLEAVGKLTGGVAHDFNNILHIISANVQLMQRTGRQSEARLRSILDAVERGARLSAQLLAFARRQPLHPGAVNVAHLIERMDSLLHRAAGEAVQIQKSSTGDLWDALVDPNQLENVLLNLVINARDAMEGEGEVTIRLENVTADPAALPDPEIVPGQYVLVAVSDTGSGMPPEVMEHAFEPFFTTKPEGKGTGLGLSMAHGFIKQSGGHIRLASTVGRGTTVTLYLPRYGAGAAGTAGAGGAPDAVPAGEVAGQPPP